MSHGAGICGSPRPARPASLANDGQWSWKELHVEKDGRELRRTTIDGLEERGELYSNQGEVQLLMLTEAGKSAVGSFQVVGGLEKTLAAISDSCDRGNIALFDGDGDFITSRSSPEGQEIRRLAKQAQQKVKMYRRNGVYVMPVWIQDDKLTEMKTPFQGPGA